MKTTHFRLTRLPRQHMRGLTLVELMISLVIGLVVVGAVLVSYLSSGQTNKRQAAYAEMNENAQIALTLMKSDLLLAGYAQPLGTVTNPGPPAITTFNKTYAGSPVFGCDNGFVNVSAATGAAACVVASGMPALEVNYEADTSNTVKTAADLPSDCKGARLPASNVVVPLPLPAKNVTFYVASNRYYLSAGNTGRSELHCASNARDLANNPTTPQPMVDNVDAMKIWYGEANAVDRRQIVRYVPASSVVIWPNIVSVRVCVLMRSSEKVLTGEDTTAGMAGYLDCDSAAQTSADGYLRRAYFLTTTLRNKMTF